MEFQGGKCLVFPNKPAYIHHVIRYVKNEIPWLIVCSSAQCR